MPRSRAPLVTAAMACAVAAALAACAPSYRVRTYDLGFSGVRTVLMEGNVLASGSLLDAADMELNLDRVDSLRAVPRFGVRIRLQTDGLEVHPTLPLALFLEGDSLLLPRDTATALRTTYEQVRIDEARYVIRYGELRRLADADEARLRVRVGPWDQERRLYPRNVENIRRFLAEHLPADSAAVVGPPARAPLR